MAITRAEEQCFLSYAKSRYRYGKMEFSTPSRFLRDIDACYLDLQGEATPASPRSTYGGSYGSSSYGSANSRINSGHSYGGSNSSHSYGSTPTLGRSLKPLTTVTRRSASPTATTGTSSSSTPAAGVGGLQVGQTIVHERFGVGQVEKIEGEGDNAKATIRFQNAGTKQLLLRFARFKT